MLMILWIFKQFAVSWFNELFQGVYFQTISLFKATFQETINLRSEMCWHANSSLLICPGKTRDDLYRHRNVLSQADQFVNNCKLYSNRILGNTDFCLAFCSWSTCSVSSLTASCCFLRSPAICASLCSWASSKSRRSFCSSASRFLFRSIWRRHRPSSQVNNIDKGRKYKTLISLTEMISNLEMQENQ